MLPNKKNLWSTPTTFDAHNIKGERKKSTGGQIEPLQQQVRLWPTPTQDSATERTKNYAQGGKPLTVAVKEEQVRMWPTPRARDYKDGSSVPPSRVKKPGMATLGQKVVMEEQKMWPTPTAHNSKEGGYPSEYKRNTISLAAEAHLRTNEKMWPTPQASDNRDRGNMSDPSVQRRIKIGKQVMLSQKVKKTKGTGSLNPDWVEWLMGYGQGYSDPDNKSSFTLDSHQGFPNEPEIARVTTENQYRKDRLKALGNSIVPQIAYHIGLAILEQEKT